MKALLKKCLIIILDAVIVLSITGCTVNKRNFEFTGDAFTDRFAAVYPSALFHLNEEGSVKHLDFDSMQDVPLCDKPNCTHTTPDCILTRFGANVPLIAENCAYYFVDEDIQFAQDDEGKPEMKLGTSLFRYDFEKGKETKLLSLADVSVAKNCYGLLMHDQIIYFITNSLSTHSGENDGMLFYNGTGGNMNLHAFDLSEMKEKDLGSLYYVDELKEYYPDAPFSGEVYMKGMFDNKIYFNVGFVAGEEKKYCFYVTYYDLTDGTYHGTPEDYENIDFAAVRYVSDDYLVICRDGEASVFQKGNDQAIVLKDPCFNQDSFLSVFDDTLYCGERAFDLSTCTAKTLERMQYKSVVAKYGDSYIISDLGMQGNFEKIPAEKLLQKVT